MKHLRNFLTVAVLLSTLVIVGCSDDNNSGSIIGPQATMKIVETAKSEQLVSFNTARSYSSDRTGLPIYALANKAGLTTLATAIEAVGLNKTLNTDGPFTVFAPTNEAFDALPEGTLEYLLANPAELTDILLYHVVAGEVTASQVVGLTEAEMLNGDTVSISVNGGVMVNNANVIATDIFAKNGVVHLIDSVLIPTP